MTTIISDYSIEAKRLQLFQIILGVVSEKKTRYLLSLSKKGGRVISHDQIRKQIKMWSRGVGERALINLIMLEFSKQILNSMRNIYIFTLFLQKLK